MPGHLVDNEFCVDLYAGVRHGHTLSRRYDHEGHSMTVAMDGHSAAAVHLGRGCEFTEITRHTTVADAAREGRTAEFVRLPRVLTDAVQLRAADPDFGYSRELRA